jgi:hypothetical protein
MKNPIIAAFVALGLTAGILPIAACAGPQATSHQGPYDNTANSLGGRYVGGG